MTKSFLLIFNLIKIKPINILKNSLFLNQKLYLITQICRHFKNQRQIPPITQKTPKSLQTTWRSSMSDTIRNKASKQSHRPQLQPLMIYQTVLSLWMTQRAWAATTNRCLKPKRRNFKIFKIRDTSWSWPKNPSQKRERLRESLHNMRYAKTEAASSKCHRAVLK